jgi:hypothetical protein
MNPVQDNHTCPVPLCVLWGKMVEEILNDFLNNPIKNSGCIVASDHRAVKRGSTSRAASLFI